MFTKMTNTVDEAIAKFDSQNILPEDWRDEIRRVASTLDENIFHGGVLLPHYTNHDLDHSCQVIGIASQMVAPIQNSFNKSEIYIFIMAALLHDIGMQCRLPHVLKKYDISLNTGSWQEAEQLRPVHELIGVDMIEGHFNDRQSFVDLGMTKTTLVNEIMQVVKAHRGEHWKEMKKTVMVERGEQVRLRFLGTLLNCADEFHKSSDRVNLEYLKRMNLPRSSKVHFFSHYLVRTIDINQDGGITIAYRIPARVSNDILDFLVGSIETKLRDKVKEFERGFFEEHITLVFLEPEISIDPTAGRSELGEKSLEEMVREIVVSLSQQTTIQAGPPAINGEPVTMYIDLDGIAVELRKRGAPSNKLAALQFAPCLVEYARRFGNPTVRRVYGRWARNPETQDYRAQGFETVQRSTTACESQITADLRARLSADEANTLIIFTGRDRYNEAISLVRGAGKQVVFVPVDTEQTRTSGTAASQKGELCEVLGIENTVVSPQAWNAKLQSWAIWLSNYRFEQGFRYFGYKKLADFALQQLGGTVDVQSEVDALVGENLLERQVNERGGTIFVLNDVHPIVTAARDTQRAIIRSLLKLCAECEKPTSLEDLHRQLKNYRIDTTGHDFNGWLTTLANERIVAINGETLSLNLDHPLVALEQNGPGLAAIVLLVTREEHLIRSSRKESNAPLTLERLRTLLSNTSLNGKADVLLEHAKRLAMFHQGANSTQGAHIELNRHSGLVHHCNQVITLLVKLLDGKLRQQRKSSTAEPSLDDKMIFEVFRAHSAFGRSTEEYSAWIKVLVDIGAANRVSATSIALNSASIVVAQTLYTDSLVMNLFHQHQAGHESVPEFQLAKSIYAPHKAAFEAIHAGRHCRLFHVIRRKNDGPVQLRLNEEHSIAEIVLATWRQVGDTASEFLRDPMHTTASFSQLHDAISFLPTDWDRHFWINHLVHQGVLVRQQSENGKTLFALYMHHAHHHHSDPSTNVLPLMPQKELRKAA